jgi:hypothetical protein
MAPWRLHRQVAASIFTGALSGMGKTQIAVEYAHRHLDEYVYTLWSNAHSREALVSGYVTIAGLSKLPEADSSGSNARGGSRQALAEPPGGATTQPTAKPHSSPPATPSLIQNKVASAPLDQERGLPAGWG